MQQKIDERLPEEVNPEMMPVNDAGEIDQEEALQLADSSFDSKLRDWLTAQNFENIQATIYLYKFENPQNGEDKALCGQWKDEIPDAHTVGLTYGAGRYLLLVSLPKGLKQPRQIKGYRFKIHPYYEELRRQAAYTGQPYFPPGARPQGIMYPAPGPQVPEKIQADPVESALRTMGEIMKIFAPMMQHREPSPDVSKILMGSYQTMNAVLKESMIESSRLVADATRKRLELPGPVDEGGDGEEKGILEQITPLITQFLPILLGGGVPAKTAETIIKTAPQFKQLVADKSELKKVIDYLDGTAGKEKTEKLLAQLKVKRPA